MEIYDYIPAATMERLGPENYKKLRHYLRFLGYDVSEAYGDWFSYHINVRNSTEQALILSKYGNLIGEQIKDCTGKEIKYETLMSMISLLITDDHHEYR